MFDFCITDCGELVYSGLNNDVEIVEVDDLLRQKIICRIKSVTKDWFNAPNIGANIESFIGEPNNETTSDLIVESIKASLSQDGLVQKKDIFFVPKVDRNKISIIVFVKRKASKKPIMINVEIDIVSGVNVKYDFDTQ